MDWIFNLLNYISHLPELICNPKPTMKWFFYLVLLLLLIYQTQANVVVQDDLHIQGSLTVNGSLAIYGDHPDALILGRGYVEQQGPFYQVGQCVKCNNSVTLHAIGGTIVTGNISTDAGDGSAYQIEFYNNVITLNSVIFVNHINLTWTGSNSNGPGIAFRLSNQINGHVTINVKISNIPSAITKMRVWLGFLIF